MNVCIQLEGRRQTQKPAHNLTEFRHAFVYLSALIFRASVDMDSHNNEFSSLIGWKPLGTFVPLLSRPIRSSRIHFTVHGHPERAIIINTLSPFRIFSQICKLCPGSHNYLDIKLSSFRTRRQFPQPLSSKTGSKIAFRLGYTISHFCLTFSHRPANLPPPGCVRDDRSQCALASDHQTCQLLTSLIRTHFCTF